MDFFLRLFSAQPARQLFTWLFLLCVSLPWLAQAQCPTGDVVLRTQAQVDSFPAGCTNLSGRLIIEGDINNLDKLKNLQSVGIDLAILGNPQLTSIASLTALTRVGGSVAIYNTELRSLEGLNNLQSVGGDVRMIGNLQLTSVAALTALTRVGGGLQIATHPVLPSLDGLNNLQSIGGSLLITNNQLTSIAALMALTRVDGGVQLYNNESLTSLQGLNNLQSTSDLVIFDNPQLAVCALSYICRLIATLPPGSVRIQDNAPGCSSAEQIQANCLAITTQPAAGSTVCVGSRVTATVSASGSGITYQWYRGNQPVSGQNSATLTLTNVQSADAGTYVVVISNSISSLTSTAFTLIVNPTPSVNITPSASTVCAGQTVTLSATPGQPSYRWSTGQTMASISVSASGNYAVTATNTSGCSASASASVTVNPTPPTPTLTTATNQPGQLYPGGQSSVTVPQYSGIVALLINGCTGTINWQGPNGNSGNTTSIPVPTSATGTFVYQATCQQQGCPSAPGSATVTVQAAPLRVVSPLFDCASGKLTLRTTGGNGQPIEYQIPSVTNGWETTNPVSIQSKDFKKSLKLRARQRSAEKGGYNSDELEYQLPTCPGARVGIPEPQAVLSVVVLGNPVTSQAVTVEVGGAEGQPLRLTLTDLRGRTVSERSIERAATLETQVLPISNQPAGVLLLRVSTPTQRQTVKVIKAE